MPSALIIGSSDGIGLALARALIAADWRTVGVSRSPAPISDSRYRHHVLDVRAPGYRETVAALWSELGGGDACIYCAGIGEELDLANLARDLEVFAVNLTGAIATATAVVPAMVAAGRGHFLALSSQADTLINPWAPSYGASKAGLSSYLHGLGMAVRSHGVHVTNVRFGFVDTKMAKSPVKPFSISADKAAQLVIRCMRKRPIRFTYPRTTAVLLWFVRWGPRLRIWLS